MFKIKNIYTYIFLYMNYIMLKGNIGDSDKRRKVTDEGFRL